MSVAPASPALGFGYLYADASSFNIAFKNNAGAVNHGIQSNAGTTHQWVSAIAADGSVTLTQPGYSDISGAVPAITALTGDVVATGPGSTTAAISVNAVTYAKIQVVGADRLLGNPTGSPADVSEITVGSGLAFSGTTLINTSPGTPLTWPAATEVLFSVGTSSARQLARPTSPSPATR